MMVLDGTFYTNYNKRGGYLVLFQKKKNSGGQGGWFDERPTSGCQVWMEGVFEAFAGSHTSIPLCSADRGIDIVERKFGQLRIIN